MKILRKLNKEIIHFAEGETMISSKYRTVYYRFGNEEIKVQLPENSLLKRLFGWFRLSRRALRLDKCNVFLHEGNLIIIRQGKVYLYNTAEKQLTQTLALRNCRNVLHQSINSTPEGYIYFGEYGNNGNRNAVPVYCSKDGGTSWEEIYTFAPGSIKHVHGCYYDHYTDKIWVCTGDFEGENCLLVADKDFKKVHKIGDGQQKYRTCNLIFTEKEVHWLMDSQLETSYHIVLDRATEKIDVRQKLMGPVWYIKELSDKGYLAATAQEIGAGVLDNKVHLYYSEDLKEWKTLATFNHDGFPKRYFKFGVIGFADGRQSGNSFYMFFEAIKGFDGKSIECCLP
ncbi:MAG: hypothetical protein GYB31_08275 [Bacteroidetes bacterium]|nr:hypothetical protein [Bacteroidota bacterium]